MSARSRAVRRLRHHCVVARTDSRPIVLRSPWASLIISLLGVLALLLGLAYFTEADGGPLVVRILFGVPLTLVGAWFGVRPWFVRVVVAANRDHVTIHKMSRKRRIPRSQIASVEIETVSGIASDAHTIGFVLTNEEHEAAASMATYTVRRDLNKTRAGRQVVVVREALNL